MVIFLIVPLFLSSFKNWSSCPFLSLLLIIFKFFISDTNLSFKLQGQIYNFWPTSSLTGINILSSGSSKRLGNHPWFFLPIPYGHTSASQLHTWFYLQNVSPLWLSSLLAYFNSILVFTHFSLFFYKEASPYLLQT